MYKEQRQETILQYIYEKKEASVKELSKMLGVSNVTIRKDLIELANMGKILKTHGGATSVESILSTETPHYQKDKTFREEKERIGKAAAKLVEEGNTIIIDGGSTPYHVVPNILDKEVMVITNDVKAAYKLALDSKAKVLVSGGYIEKSVFSLLGSTSEHLFQTTHSDIAFIGLDGMDINYGASVKSFTETPVKQAMIKNAEKVAAVIDHSKLNQKMLIKFADIEDFDYIITDEMSDEDIKAYKERGVEVIIAK
ncbi:DeoR/GlpR family DNA-binding transcription regulator [Anaerofustis butyriciformans]|uniref:DeoR/GlpR family DNA-binding transcription regulator n=1 Tax=Anaerofustis butyriciformans TaxID=3108533 RepID=UPI002E37F416|nr:DeoR/GlpR family DNA-binding transcription regulator [Anaerofustis sp. HA2171]